MDRHDTHARRPRLIRAGAMTVAAVAGAVVTWKLRPATTAGTAAPDADIVLAAAWLAWVLAGYLCIAVAATSIAAIAARLGIAGQSLARIAPRRLRRLIDTVLTVGVAAALATGPALGTAAATAAAAGTDRPTASAPLDWPGLGSAPPHLPAAGHHRAPTAPRSVVVVRPGDTLWAIAARHLGPGASGTAITAAWHAWYAANRSVIGANPSLIHVGQHLVPPPATPSDH